MQVFIHRRRVVLYQEYSAAPENIELLEALDEAAQLPAFTMSGTAEFVAFDARCEVRMPDETGACTRRPDLTEDLRRRAPECPRQVEVC